MNAKYLLLSSFLVFCASTGAMKRNTAGQSDFLLQPSVHRSFFCHPFSFFLNSTVQSSPCLELIERGTSMLDCGRNCTFFAIAITFSLFILSCWPVSDKSSQDSAGLTPNPGIHRHVES